MTAAARITQADMDRAARTVRAAGFERARIVMDLAHQRIEIILGDTAQAADESPYAEWGDDDI